MKLLNHYEGTINFRSHVNVINLLDVHSTVDLTDEDKEVHLHATIAMGDHKDFLNQRKRTLCVLYTDSDIVSLEFNDNEIATQASYTFIKLHRIRQLPYIKRVVCVLEELVHHFWDTGDEIEVSRIVCEMLSEVGYDKTTGNYIFRGDY